MAALPARADFAIAADDCRFVFAYSAIAACPDGGLSWSLPRMLGLRRALDFAFLDTTLNAAEAERLARSAVGAIRSAGKAQRRFTVALTIGIGRSLNGQQRYREAEQAVQWLKAASIPGAVGVLLASATARLGLGKRAPQQGRRYCQGRSGLAEADRR